MAEHTVSLIDSVKGLWPSFKEAEEYFRDTEENLRFCLKLCEPSKSLGVAVSSSIPCKILFMLPSCKYSLKEFLSLLSLSNKAAEDEKTDTALESVLWTSCFLHWSRDFKLGKGETEDGTRTTENMRCAPTRVSWSGWTIANSNWWKSASGNTWQVWHRINSWKITKSYC